MTATDIAYPYPLPYSMPPKGPMGTFKLDFVDTFSGTSFDTKLWSPNLWFNGIINNELQAYRPEQCIVADGRLTIRSERKPTALYWTEKTNNPYWTGEPVMKDFASGFLHTYKKYHFTYGITEIRAKVARGQGLWSAGWILGADKPAGAEIDMFEVLNNGTTLNEKQVNSNFHFNGAHPYHKTGLDLASGYHTYTCEWSTEGIVFYLDGIEYGRYTGPTFDKPMHLILNVAVGGNWPGPVPETTVFPTEMWVDYIKVWKRA